MKATLVALSLQFLARASARVHRRSRTLILVTSINYEACAIFPHARLATGSTAD
jgi:hypothetical protein